MDIGDQGVNDARWFQDEAILVTASGTGRWGGGHMYLLILWISYCEVVPCCRCLLYMKLCVRFMSSCVILLAAMERTNKADELHFVQSNNVGSYTGTAMCATRS